MAETIENLTIHVLREIRDEIVATRTELRTELHTTRTELRAELQATRTELGAELHTANERLGAVESTLLELAGQQRFIVRGQRTLLERDRRLEEEVDDLRTRLDAVEKQLAPGSR
jgi:chromosome segregation ATPase